MHGFMRRFRHRFTPDGKQMTLRQMQAGQSGTVVRIEDGADLVNRLNALGIRVGKKITKVGSMVMRGPITIQLDTSQVALGFGMANKIIIELD